MYDCFIWVNKRIFERVFVAREDNRFARIQIKGSLVNAGKTRMKRFALVQRSFECCRDTGRTGTLGNGEDWVLRLFQVGRVRIGERRPDRL